MADQFILSHCKTLKRVSLSTSEKESLFCPNAWSHEAKLWFTREWIAKCHVNIFQPFQLSKYYTNNKFKITMSFLNDSKKKLKTTLSNAVENIFLFINENTLQRNETAGHYSGHRSNFCCPYFIVCGNILDIIRICYF